MEVAGDVDHMAQEKFPQLKKIVTSSILDSFSKLESNVENSRVCAGAALLQHLYEKQCESEDDGTCTEVNYAMKRIVRGLGTAKATKRAGFFSVLVEILTLIPTITVQDVMSLVEKELRPKGSSSKKEVTESYGGRILVIGSLIHSKRLFEIPRSEQTEILRKLIAAGHKKSFFFVAVSSFLVDFMEKVDEEHFKEVLWPLLEKELNKSWEEHSLDSLYLLLEARNRFPDVLKKKFLIQSLGSKHIIDEKSISQCAKLLLDSSVQNINHPIYEEFCKQICGSQFLFPFWESLAKELEKHPTQNREQNLLCLLELLLKHTSNKDKIPEFLCDCFMEQIIKTFQTKKMKASVARKATELFTRMSSMIESDDVEDEIRVSFLRRVLFYPGNLMFDKLAGTRIVYQLSSHMKLEGLKKIVRMLKDVISASKPKIKNLQGETGVWTKWDRTNAAQLFTRLLSLPLVQENLKWKVKQLKYLISVGLFASTSREPGSVGNLPVATEVRECIFRLLDLKISKVDQLITLLSSIVHYLHNTLFVEENPPKLCQPLSESSAATWLKTIAIINELEAMPEDAVLGKRSGRNMFLVLFLHMALQLFQNPTLAEETLQELYCCYERTKQDSVKPEGKKRKSLKVNSEDEPYWVEVVVDLFLSLLSRNSHLLRNMVGAIFPHLCCHLTDNSMHQILEVLNPNEKQPLDNVDSEGDEDSDDSDNEKESSNKGKHIVTNDDNEDENDNDDDDDSDSDDDDDDLESGDEPVNAHVKMAVQNALKKAGGGGGDSDEESIDMDKMTEEESNKLDTALSEAFKLLKHNQSDKKKKKKKKQSKDDETVMHFRVRVLDLLDMYLANQPTLILVLEIILPLFDLLEFCIKDDHQKPLENRIRYCLKKLSSVKQFSSTSGVSEKLLSDVLCKLLQKGERAAAVYQNMGLPLVQCSTFLARMSHQLNQQTVGSSENENSNMLELYKEALNDFFKQRDSLLPVDVLKSVLTLSWNGAWILADAILNFAFDSSVRPFRRHQALVLLTAFYSNSRLIIDASPTFREMLQKIEVKLSENAINMLNSFVSEKEGKGTAPGVKEIFVKELFCLMNSVWLAHMRCKENAVQTVIDWESFKTAACHYWEVMSLATDTKSALKKLSNVLKFSLAKKNSKEKKKSTEEKTKEINEDHDTKENGSNVNSISEHADESSDEDSDENSDGDTGDKGYESGNEQKNEKEEEEVEQPVKKRKRPKTNDTKGKSILKKQAKKARLAAMSEGLDESLSFGGVTLSKLQELTSETETVADRRKKQKLQKRKKNNGGIADLINQSFDEDSDVPQSSKESKAKDKSADKQLKKKKKVKH